LIGFVHSGEEGPQAGRILGFLALETRSGALCANHKRQPPSTKRIFKINSNSIATLVVSVYLRFAVSSILPAVALAVSISPLDKLRVPSIVEGLKELSLSIGEGGSSKSDRGKFVIWDFSAPMPHLSF
jgi:hypothetical protein